MQTVGNPIVQLTQFLQQTNYKEKRDLEVESAKDSRRPCLDPDFSNCEKIEDQGNLNTN